MDDVAFSVNHQVSIVSVLNSKQVCKQAVPRQTTNEIRLSFLKFVAEVPLVEVAQVAQPWLVHGEHFLFESVD